MLRFLFYAMHDPLLKACSLSMSKPAKFVAKKKINTVKEG
jgi:hypothetical protein